MLQIRRSNFVNFCPTESVASNLGFWQGMLINIYDWVYCYFAIPTQPHFPSCFGTGTMGVAYSLRWTCSKMPCSCNFFIFCSTTSLRAIGIDLGWQNFGLEWLLINSLAVKSFIVSNSSWNASLCTFRISVVCSVSWPLQGSSSLSVFVVTN